MKPSLGRIVHYTLPNGSDAPPVQAAIITGLNEDGTVALHVYGRPGGPYVNFPTHDLESVSEAVGLLPGSPAAAGKWSWPPRVEEKKTKPTIAELESILNSEGTGPVNILPNGEVVQVTGPGEKPPEAA